VGELIVNTNIPQLGEYAQSRARNPRATTSRLRVQLLLIVLCQSIFALSPLVYVMITNKLPYGVVSKDLYFDTVQRTALMCAIVAGLGLIIVRQLSDFPGSKTAVYIFPGLALAYGVFGIFVFLLRVDYARPIVVLSMIGALAWMFLDYLWRERRMTPTIGILPDGNQRDLQNITGVQWLTLSDPMNFSTGLDTVVADLSYDHAEKWQRFLAICVLQGIPVHDIKSIQETFTGRVHLEHLSENTFGAVLPSSLYIKVKRLVDFTLAVVLFPFAALVIGIFALLIRLESKGAAIFKQHRVGYRATTFTMYKLRSMRLDSEVGPAYTSESDPRITRIGGLIRKYRIDELPQIINVLKGEMSWIGPRPEPLTVATHYDRELPFYVYRQSVRPGLTGWAQVNQGYVAYVGETNAAISKLQYDFYYIKHFSPWLDILIVFKTIHTILTGFKAR
jgi:lipopolysaccharide/colanic/teichoic acid biosynthesis glycosyltransferase